VIACQVLDERGDAGGVAASLTAQADRDLRHGWRPQGSQTVVARRRAVGCRSRAACRGVLN
jgi:hypothetical protein